MSNSVKKDEKKKKEYVVIYKSKEHYEVLGYVTASSLEEAKNKAQAKLLPEAKYYNVTKAEVDEIAKFDEVSFDLSK